MLINHALYFVEKYLPFDRFFSLNRQTETGPQKMKKPGARYKIAVLLFKFPFNDFVFNKVASLLLLYFCLLHKPKAYAKNC